MREQIIKEFPASLRADHERLSEWVTALIDRYRERILISVIDPQSPLGIFKSLRHWVRVYPTFIIDSQQKISGWDQAALEMAIETRLVAQKH